MYQSGRVGDEAKKRKSPAKSGRVGITVNGFGGKEPVSKSKMFMFSLNASEL